MNEKLFKILEKMTMKELLNFLRRYKMIKSWQKVDDKSFIIELMDKKYEK